MRPIRWYDLQGFGCGRCRGHFIRARHLQRFLEKHGPDRIEALAAFTRDAPPSPRPLTCPGCGTRSFRVVRRGILEIDICASCSSAYFDEGESTIYLRQSLLKRFGQEVDDAVFSTDGDWSDLIQSFLSDFFD
jgi:Zn-finger nucleic acid-binding protein